MSEIISILDKVEKSWPLKKGLFFFLLFIVLFQILLFDFLELGRTYKIIFLILSILASVLVWLYTRRLPRTKKNKVGFVVSLYCEDDKELKKVKEDFIKSLRKLIIEGKTGHTFQFIEVPPYIACKVVDVDEAQKLRIKTKSHFLIYGEVKIRNIDGKDQHYMELNGLVAHRIIKDDEKAKLSIEFRELLPKSVIIPQENDLFSFKFTSEIAEIVAKYIIGIAAAVSGELDYAESLQREVSDKINSSKSKFDLFEKLKERIPIRICEINEGRANHCATKWVETHKQEYIDNLGKYLQQIESDIYGTPRMYTLYAIYYFLNNHDIEKSFEWLNKINKENRDATWYCNTAFLNAYQEDLRTAARHYRKCAELIPVTSIISQVEDFLLLISKREPDKFQLYFCLGYFNWKVKGDKLQASKDFRKFIGNDNIEKFPNEKQLVGQWLIELEPE